MNPVSIAIRMAVSLGLAAAASASAAPVPLHIGGRAAPVAGGGVEIGWPGVYLEGRFRGPEVSVAVDTATEHLAVAVDGRVLAVLEKPGNVRRTFSNLGPGAHVVRIDKLTESQSGSARILDVTTGAAATPLPPAGRARQIEFIGDSYTVGYGAASSRRTCTRQEVHDLTDTRLAFGPRLAGLLGADYRINAYSGFGIVRNYGGARPGESMLTRYPRLLPGDPTRLDPGSPDWRPQLIVIGLGTNDFSTPLHAGEGWADAAELRADYRAQYIAFARDLMQRQPQARLILMGGPDFAAEVEGVAAALDPGGRRVRVLRYAGLELTACDWHPSAADHARLADALRAVVDSMAGIWSRAGAAAR